MKLNMLGISVGNTRTRIGAFIQGELQECATFSNDTPDALNEAIEHAYDTVKDLPDVQVLMASVNRPMAELIEKLVAGRLGATVRRVERDLSIPIGRQVDADAKVGDDRLLNAAAAYDILKQACVVVDAGTAITVDYIDGAGTFHGGAIAAGAQLQLDALHQRTDLLPEVEIKKPAEPIGHNTVEAMRTGVYHGLRGMVRELVEQYAEVAGAFPMVVATGGDGNLLFRDYELIDRIIPNLTMIGLYTTLRIATEEQSKADN
jgi:type III pantothenate kinase